MQLKICLSDYDPKDVIRIIREWTELTQKEFGKSIGKAERYRTMKQVKVDIILIHCIKLQKYTK